MVRFYSERELAGLIKPTKLSERPVNPKTGRPYAKSTKAWWVWYYGLSDSEKGILADLEANI